MGKIFYKNTTAIICLLIAMFCSSGSSLADMREAELFEKAYEYYLAFNPEKAIETFDLFLQQFPDSSALDSILFWRAKSLMQMKRVEESAKGFRKLREVFPESSYAIFAEKELETLKKLLQKADKSETLREMTAKTSDAKMPAYEDRIKKLEKEMLDLEKQLSDAEKKRQLTEKGLSKALDDKNALESQIDELKRSRDDLARKTSLAEKGDKERAGLAEEKKTLEAGLKERDEKIRNLAAELNRSDEKIAFVTRELSGKMQQSQKDWEKLDLHIKELKAGNIALDQAVKEKDRTLADAMQSLSALQKKVADSESSKQREKENLNQSIAQLSAEKVFIEEQAALEKKRADDLAAQAGDVKKWREEAAYTATELEKLQKEKIGLLKEIKVLGVKLSETEEKAKALIAVRDKDTEKERNALLAKSQDLEKKFAESETRVRQFIEERQKIDINVREQEQKLAKAVDSLAILEKRALEEKRGLELRVRESEEKITAMSSKAEGDKNREIKAISEKLKEADKRIKDSDVALKKSQEERQAAEVRMQELQAAITKSRESIALLEKTLKASEQEKEKKTEDLSERIRLTEAEKKGIGEELARERKKAAELSGKGAEKETALLNDVKTLEKTRQDLEARLTEKQSLDQASVIRVQNELAEAKRLNDLYAKKNAEIERNIESLQFQMREYEKPFLRIGKEWYSLSAVLRDGMLARSVTDKIQAKNALWRTGNIIDDFMAEQILARKAQAETLSADSSVKESLMKQYALTAAEGSYLDKYLAIDRLVKMKLAVPAITEKDAREYYDKHREQYLHGRENRIRVLSLKYGKADELEKSLIAVEMQQEAQEGKPFDAIARKRSAVAAMKEMSLSRLPDWVRVNIESLREGEISNIISADNEFMIIQAIPSKPAYRSFEEVRKEIEKKLSAEQLGRKQSLEDWLSTLKKDAEFLR